MITSSQTFNTVRETFKADGKRHLDWGNNAWLYADGSVAIRAPGNEFKTLGNVSPLRGAPAISKALAMVFSHRGF